MFPSHRSESQFLSKTYQMVEDPTTDDIISWNESGTAFVIWKTADLAKYLLPNYFKHNNFSSFVRQLNTYGFRKTVQEKWEFANDHFRRSHKDLLHHIRRRKRAKHIDAGRTALISFRDCVGPTSSHSISSKNKPPLENAAVSAAKVEALLQENEKLKKEKECLLSEKKRADKQCDGLMALVAKYVNQRPCICMISPSATCGPLDNACPGKSTVVKRGREEDAQDHGLFKELKICD